MQKISVALVTKNRPTLLLKCLASVISQHDAFDELIVVDGSSTDVTESHCVSLFRNTLLRTQYIKNLQGDVISGRNLALSAAQNRWLTFIDDDCVVQSHYAYCLKQEISKNKKAVFFLGRSIPSNNQNIYSFAESLFYELWTKSKIAGNSISDPEILDTKNVTLDRHYLKAKKIQFSSDRLGKDDFTCEDSDLGMQIYQKGGKGKYVDSLMVFHQGSIHFRQFLTRMYTHLRGHALYEKKWEQIRINLKIKTKPFLPLFMKVMRQYCEDTRISATRLSFYLLFFCGSFILSRLLKTIQQKELNGILYPFISTR